MTLHAALLVSLESSWWVRVHQLSVTMFGATVWKLLIIEPFSQWKLNKSKTEKKCFEVLGVFLVLLENPRWVRFYRFYFTIFRAKGVEGISFSVNFVAENSNKLQKLGLERQISWALNVFTPGPMSQATLVVVIAGNTLVLSNCFSLCALGLIHPFLKKDGWCPDPLCTLCYVHFGPVVDSRSL